MKSYAIAFSHKKIPMHKPDLAIKMFKVNPRSSFELTLVLLRNPKLPTALERTVINYCFTMYRGGGHVGHVTQTI